MSCIKRTLTIWMKFPLMNYLKVYLDMGCLLTKCLRAFPRKHIIPIVKLTTRHMIKRNGINLQYIQIFVIQTYPVSWAFQPPCRTMQCALY